VITTVPPVITGFEMVWPLNVMFDDVPLIGRPDHTKGAVAVGKGAHSGPPVPPTSVSLPVVCSNEPLRLPPDCTKNTLIVPTTTRSLSHVTVRPFAPVVVVMMANWAEKAPLNSVPGGDEDLVTWRIAMGPAAPEGAMT